MKLVTLKFVISTGRERRGRWKPWIVRSNALSSIQRCPMFPQIKAPAFRRFSGPPGHVWALVAMCLMITSTVVGPGCTRYHLPVTDAALTSIFDNQWVIFSLESWELVVRSFPPYSTLLEQFVLLFASFLRYYGLRLNPY